MVLKLGALFIVNSNILGLIWGNNSTKNLFNSHSKGESGNLLSFGTAIIPKFNILHSLKNYIKSVLL